MSDEKKEIKIDPILFKIPDNKTRKQKAPKVPKIKVKNTKPEKKAKASTLKRNLLRMIRGHQEKRLKEAPPITTTILDKDAPVKSDFEQSVEFLSKINASQPSPPPPPHNPPKHNNTLKQFVSPPPPSIRTYNEMGPPVQVAMPPLRQSPVMQINPPKYGCLKNGSLPTYRVWKNQTQRNYPAQIPRNTMDIAPSPIQMKYENRLRDKIKEMSEIKQHQERKTQLLNNKVFKKPKKQKRIIRRTFRTGKSKAYPRISVLVSNKTLRNDANLKKTELKEAPMDEVKQYLKQQGFIKVGTSTPNNVLREMYESAKMICGELKNYSPENLLYNYFNDDQTSSSSF